jgi:hypothetical protein
MRTETELLPQCWEQVADLSQFIFTICSDAKDLSEPNHAK